jgi:hypothetical protein
VTARSHTRTARKLRAKQRRYVAAKKRAEAKAKERRK